MEEIFLILLGIAWAIGTPLVAIIALARTAGLRQQSANLAAEVAQLRRQLLDGGTLPPPFVATPSDQAAPQAQTVDTPTLPPQTEGLPPIVPAPVFTSAVVPPPVEASAPPAPPFEPEPVAAGDIPPSVPPTPAIEPVQPGWEQRLGARAFLWIGAITLALAAVFLVRYSIEEGYLSAEIRVILAALFGFALIAGAEKIRARDDRVAQALAAAGVAALYGSLFSAVALYGMISKVAAGGGAAALTAFGIGLSLRHGVLVATLAFVGGFIGPAIIGSEQPNTPVLFGYLFAIAVGTLSVIRVRGWWPLGWGVLAGSAAWTALWMLAAPQAAELHWVGLFLVGIAGLFVWATWRRLAEHENPTKDVVALVWTALAGTGALLVAVIVQDNGVQMAGWLTLALHGVGLYALGRWTPRFQYAAVLAPVLSLVALGFWWLSTRLAPADWNDERFTWLVISFGGFYAIAAFALLWNAARPGFWAALSVAATLTHFILSWYVLRNVATGTPWGLISVGLAIPFLVGAERLVRWRDQMVGATEALGYLAVGVAFFIGAAIPLELNREWITVAYAIELAAVAGIASQLGLVALRQLCWPLLAIVIIRFVVNPEILSYPLGLTPIFNWILWGYGISIAAFVVALRFLRPTGDVRLVRAVEASVALLAFVLVTLQVRSIFQSTSMTALDADFMERAFYVLVWGAFALAALWMARRDRDPVALWAWRLSGALTVTVVIVIQVLIANPIFETADVGRLPILNGLLLAYAVLAVMAFLARRWIVDVEPEKNVALVAEVAASILSFVYVSLEVRHLFDPGFERHGLDAHGLELYTYSIVWLLFGVALLALGFVRRAAALRHAGMIIVCIVVGKVFLIDMAGLQGLLRVFSFLGLGAALIGLGYAYRRFGFDSR